MYRLLNLLSLLFILSSCAPVGVAQSLPATAPATLEPIPTPAYSLPTITATVFAPIPTSTPVSIVATQTLTPVIPTPIACDPFTADFCIMDGHFILQRPVNPPANESVDATYPYGSTANGTRDPHHGVEFVNETGTPVHAAADGEVLFAGPDQEAIYSPWIDYYGNLVVFQHDDGLFTLYAHLSKINVQAGQRVMVGDKIGEIGSTGAAIGSHLHFEVRRGNVQDYFSTQNPELWLAPRQDESGQLLGAFMISVVDQAFHPRYAEFTIDHYTDRNQARVKTYYLTTYTPELMAGNENAALGDLPAGDYRIALSQNGRLFERWVEVESGKLTQVVIVVK